MKLMKYITGCSAALLLLAGCNKEEGPNIDDYFLNYEIPEIPVTEDYQVGIFYYKGNDITTGPNGEPNFTRWELLTLTDKELSAKNDYNNLTPQVMPESQKRRLFTAGCRKSKLPYDSNDTTTRGRLHRSWGRLYHSARSRSRFG